MNSLSFSCNMVLMIIRHWICHTQSRWFISFQNPNSSAPTPTTTARESPFVWWPSPSRETPAASHGGWTRARRHMATRNWEQRNLDIARNETNRELESQRLELYQANQWWITLKEKRLIYLENWNEKQNLPRKSHKKLPRNREITKDLLRRNRERILLLWVSSWSGFRIW